MTTTDIQRAIDAVWRIESPRLIAGLVRIVRDIGLAEDLAQDALVAALEQWPVSGVPRNPGAWLMAAAKHRAIDAFRRNKLLERKHAELGYELEAEQKAFPAADKHNRWQLVASPDAAEGSLKIHQDARLFLAELDGSQELAREIEPGRHAWLQVLRGEVTLGGQTLKAGDGAALSAEPSVNLAAAQAAEVMLFDLA